MHPAARLMPEGLHVRGGGSHDPSLLPLLGAMASGVGSRRVGAATVMTRLADIVITRVVVGAPTRGPRTRLAGSPRYAILKSAEP